MEALALTVATLLAKKAGEAFGTESAKHAWSLVRRLADTVKRKLSGDDDAEQAVEKLETEPADERHVQTVASIIEALVRSDPAFGQELEALVDEARQDPELGRFVTEISGNASVGKVTNIGEVHGDVSF